MRRVLVRYKVKPDQAATNAELVRAVYEELAHTRPAGFRYATFQLDDGVSFMHFASQESDANPLAESAAFQRFQENIRDRCEEPPTVAELTEVGSYNFLGEAS
jgi:L-rhamnose mutarotase